MTESSEKSPTRWLATPISDLPGVGPSRAKALARLGLWYVSDLLFYFPRDYVDLSDERTIADLDENIPVSLRGTVEEVELRSTGAGRRLGTV